MIVNVSQCASAFDETLHALKFSAIARKVSTTIKNFIYNAQKCNNWQDPYHIRRTLAQDVFQNFLIKLLNGLSLL